MNLKYIVAIIIGTSAVTVMGEPMTAYIYMKARYLIPIHSHSH